ncbi:MAG: hypothetical protein LR011_11485 [Verrucomicrobia bacterium]|nr:hypothetical protein [Verrucomicrobiota bacterium]
MVFKVNAVELDRDDAGVRWDGFQFLLVGLMLMVLTGCQAISQHKSSQSGKTGRPMPPPRAYVVVETNPEDVQNGSESEEDGLGEGTAPEHKDGEESDSSGSNAESQAPENSLGSDDESL